MHRRDGCDIAALEGAIGRGCARRWRRLAEVTERLLSLSPLISLVEENCFLTAHTRKDEFFRHLLGCNAPVLFHIEVD